MTSKSVQVIATTYEGTRTAIQAATPLAQGRGARLSVVVPRIASDPAEDDVADWTDRVVRAYRHLIEELGGTGHIQICLCRTIEDLVERVINRDSTVVIGGPVGGWRISPEQRFANQLSRDGYHVIYASTGPCKTTRRVAFSATAAFALLLAFGGIAYAQPPAATAPLQYGGFLDVADLWTSNSPSNHLFRNRGTTPRVNELDVNMAAAYLRKAAAESPRLGFEATVQAGEDSKIFGFSATAPNIGGADALLHFGPTNVSYVAPLGSGLTLQGGIFSSLVGYDSLYAKDNIDYTRPWGADYTPYLMLGINAAYSVTPRLTATAAVVNGYWHLAHANDVPSIVGQLAYKLRDAVTIKQTMLYGPHQADTSLGFWRVLSDTIVERKTDRVTTAFEYQLSSDRVDEVSEPRAWWMSAQAPVRWDVEGPFAIAVRPEFCWDSRGRWTGFEQSIRAFTATVEYRVPYRSAQAIVRAEYRLDDSRGGVASGFFEDGNGGPPSLTPQQHTFALALILTVDGTVKR